MATPRNQKIEAPIIPGRHRPGRDEGVGAPKPITTAKGHDQIGVNAELRGPQNPSPQSGYLPWLLSKPGG